MKIIGELKDGSVLVCLASEEARALAALGMAFGRIADGEGAEAEPDDLNRRRNKGAKGGAEGSAGGVALPSTARGGDAGGTPAPRGQLPRPTCAATGGKAAGAGKRAIEENFERVRPPARGGDADGSSAPQGGYGSPARQKKCVVCGGEFTDTTRTNTRKVCDRSDCKRALYSRAAKKRARMIFKKRKELTANGAKADAEFAARRIEMIKRANEKATAQLGTSND